MIAPAHEAEFLLLVKDMFRPAPDLMVWEWCEENISLGATETAVSGMYSSELTPFVRKILEFYRDPELKTMTIMAGTQVLKTIVLMLGAAYWISHNEGRILWVMHSEGKSRGFSKNRWKKLLEGSPGMESLVPANRDYFMNLEQNLGGTILNFTGSNSAGNLSELGVNLLQLDEVDKYPERTDAEGDGETQAKQRTKARDNAKTVLTSSPTTTSGSIWRSFIEGTMEEWFVPCPDCGKSFVLATGNEDAPVGRLVWDQSARGEDGEWDWEMVKESARMECPHCGYYLDDGEKVEAVAAGDWVVMNEHALPGHVSYHLASHNSPWASCRLYALVMEFLTFKRRFDLRSWDNYWKGWPSLDEVKRPEATKLMSRREHWEGVPDGALLYTIGVDTQDDRLEASLIGWGGGMESWTADHAPFYGDPGRGSVWNELKMYLLDACKKYRVTAIGIDTGGHHTDAAYLFVKQNQKQLPIYAMKGSSQTAKPIVSRPGRANRMGVKLYMVGSDTAKERLYSKFGLAEKGAGYCHFHDSLDDAYFEGLVAEEVQVKWVKGVLKRQWVKTYERNEPLDCNVYALAALHIRGLREVIRVTGQQELDLPEPEKKESDGESAVPARPVSHSRKGIRRKVRMPGGRNNFGM